jgi:hypothetical protein
MLLMVLFGLLVVAALSVLAGAGFLSTTKPSDMWNNEKELCKKLEKLYEPYFLQGHHNSRTTNRSNNSIIIMKLYGLL